MATKHKMSIISDREQYVNPLNPKSDQNIISPYIEKRMENMDFEVRV